jgi:hypothetical protein
LAFLLVDSVMSQVRVGAGWFNVLFAVMFGGLVWSGLWLRNIRVRTLPALNWSKTPFPIFGGT